MNQLAMVQDCGLIINPKTAESQCLRRLHHVASAARSTKSALWMPATGRMLNADMEFYKLAGIKDIGEIVVSPGHRPGRTTNAV